MIKTVKWLTRAAACLTAAFCSMSAALPVLAANTPDSSDSNSFSDGTLTYSKISDSMNVTISSCSTSATNVNIMSQVDGYKVVGIDEGAFSGCSSMQSLTFPKDGYVANVGAYAFAECTALKHVTLPDSITAIPVGMFAYCTSLEEITLGSAVTSIDDEAFSNCVSLKSIDLPETVETMGGAIFYMCSSLETMTIPEKVQELGAYTFLGCSNLKSFHVSSTLKNLGSGPFLGCTNLTDLTADADHPNYQVKDGLLYSKDGKILYFYPPSRTDASFTVPDGVIDVFDGAFFQCENLSSVILPEHLTTIGSGAFDYCSNLKSMVIPESVTQIMSTAFADCTALESVTFVGADREDGGIGEDLVIGDHAFYACDSLHEVLLPKRVTAIGDYALGCTEMVDDNGGRTEIAMKDFLLKGYSAAETYAKNCSVDVNFSPMEFPWKTVIFWVIGGAVLLVIVFFAVRIVKKNMMTPEERAALREAKAEQAAAALETEGDSLTEAYESILGEEETEEETQKKPVDAIDLLSAPVPKMDSLLHHTMHGHADADADIDEDAVILPEHMGMGLPADEDEASN